MKVSEKTADLSFTIEMLSRYKLAQKTWNLTFYISLEMFQVEL